MKIWSSGVLMFMLLTWCPVSCHQITVATYNLWNIMFNWDVRRLRIALMLKEAGADVVGLQEVRGDIGSGRNQVSDLQELLTHVYPYHVFLPSQHVTYPAGVLRKRWQLEGVGLLSRWPVVNQTGIVLKHHGGPDTNMRVTLQAQLDLSDRSLTVLVSHFSYDRTQQCSNAADILKHLQVENIHDAILLGDFNTYKDFEWPVQQLTGSHDLNRCPPNQKFARSAVHHTFQDAWLTVHPADRGYTFSNMPEPGLESRPDRIYVSEQMRVESARLLGDGRMYKERYYYHVVLSRLGKLWETMQGGTAGRACLIDCGPHASCRCWVCVGGGDHSGCVMPDCEECSPSARLAIDVSLIILLLLFLLVLYAVLQVLQAMNYSGYGEIGTCLGAHCCLCNPQLYSGLRHPHGRASRLCLCNRLPPMMLLVLTLLLFLCGVQLTTLAFTDLLQDVFNIIPEEFFPSDHLMLVASLTWSNPS